MLPSLLLLNVAHAATGVVLPSPGAMPEQEKLQKHLAKALDRPELTLVDEGLPEPEALRELLLEHPLECGPWLPEEQLADLFVLQREIGELFVVLPAGRKAKDALVWRYDVAHSELFKQDTGRGPLPPWTASGAHVLVLDPAWAAPQSLAEARVLRPPESLDLSDFARALATESDPCVHLPIEAHAEVLRRLWDEIPDALYVATSASAWRWVPAAGRLQRLDLDASATR